MKFICLATGTVTYLFVLSNALNSRDSHVNNIEEEATSAYADNYWEEMARAEAKFADGVGRPVWSPPVPAKSDIRIEETLTGKAVVDSCFCSYTEIYWTPCTDLQVSQQGCMNRTSESYAWGVTRTEDRVFWGTVANEQCLETPGNYVTTSYIACTDDFYLNWEIPSVYMYSQGKDSYESIAESLTGVHFDRLNHTVALRAAGQRNGVAMLAGFTTTRDSVNLFAFDSKTGAFLDSKEFADSDDVRKFTYDINHDLYVGISRLDGTGDIYRFVGSVEDPVHFEVVANIGGDPAELSFYGEQLLVGTWAAAVAVMDTTLAHTPFLALSPGPADELPGYDTREELFAAQVNRDVDTTNNMHIGIGGGEWRNVWSISDYEPDPVVAFSYGISVNVQVGEWVYWGTVQYPDAAVPMIARTYPDSHFNRRTASAASHRAVSLFRGRYLDNPQKMEVELLYGEPLYPVFDDATSEWVPTPNKLSNKMPKFGRGGFGNVFNMYLWSMALYNDYLLIGTFDTYGILGIWYNFPLPPEGIGFAPPDMGSDLYILKVDREAGTVEPAVWVTTDGYNNPTNWGLRNIMVNQYAQNDTTVFISTANAYNADPRGGWEMLKLVFE